MSGLSIQSIKAIASSRSGPVLDERHGIDAGEGALARVAHVQRRALHRVGVDALRIEKARDIGLAFRDLHDRRLVSKMLSTLGFSAAIFGQA
jgi:hypothetical protein